MTELSAEQRRRAEAFNTARVIAHPSRDAYIRALRTAVGLGAAGSLDGDFAQQLANWQERHPTSVPGRRYDGHLHPRTEAHLGIPLDEMEDVARRAEALWQAGGTFYDSWSNDGRDNDQDGQLDEGDEQTPDGAHYGRVYQGFQIDDGSSGRTRIAPVSGDYQYRFCSDFIARVLREAGIIRGGYARVYEFGGGALRAVAYRLSRDVDYPERYLRGDLIGHERSGEHGAHIGIVVQSGATNGGSAAPTVIDLPGPTSLRAVGLYRENGEHADGRRAGVRGDIVRESWPDFRINEIRPPRRQFLIRLVYSLLHRNSRTARLPRTEARG